MIRLSTRRRGDGLAEILGPDLTPLLDIIFVLLMFFVLTANSVQRMLELDLPRETAARTQAADDHEAITISLYRDGPAWGLGETRFDDWPAFEAAVSAAASARPAPRVTLAGDREVPLENFLKVVALLGAHGLAAAQVLMETGSGGDPR